MMKKILYKWHWYWFQRHMKWLSKKWRKQIYQELDKALSEIIKNTPIQYTEDAVIDLVKRVEHDDLITGNKYDWAKFENGVVIINDRLGN